ncbi:hypothetical protein GYMLUDRAFT_47020 [Collybiopsis luxurians FD-317 M1]|uniref:Uncharacterized protein n=1 Tax=Collybiopsis luxurians FD-317 M1 TaxID=944289 RepID=A0A0D0CMP1_9AGAR|nr:hypothetical protein GYMLUDRAFT_47020 [Collybiopsis luxurians FD-317 M1]
MSSDWPIPRGFLAHTDASWIPSPSSHPHYLLKKEAIFRFPLNGSASGRLFCVSRSGSYIGVGGGGHIISPAGSFHLAQSDHVQDDYVEMKVAVEYNAAAAACVEQDLKVCELKRDISGRVNQCGIGLFTRNLTSHHHHHTFNNPLLQIKVIVTLPKSRNEDVLQLRNFETDMPLFAHQIDNLGSSVHFRTISLRSANAPILVESLNANKINVETSNAPIEGSFTSTSSTNLVTNNSSIRTSMSLKNTDPVTFTELNMKSCNGPISSSIILSNSPQEHRPDHGTQNHNHNLTHDNARSGGNFAISASTQNAPLALTFPSAPISCNLHLQASSALAPVQVSLPNTYQGSFQVQTNCFSPAIVVHPARAIATPNLRRSHWGRGGSRATTSEAVRGVTFAADGFCDKTGWVYSTEEGKWRGDARVSTSLAPVTLRL